ncbi:hypothetical protein [Neobacillus ginsengisoli]|uniref:Uncharacterized protein n=1 Tax=Neobacillus ginsengisoli TaxID=904295 RepID=A0ABT9XQT1_9BACI|nr:hypothetical protein [Neobacillus ginsengisoli]MDQ0197889.1 hypothetical protein [Neobacillus ginsengisoli]
MKKVLSRVSNLFFPALICFVFITTMFFLPLSSSDAFAKSSVSTHNVTEKATTYITSFKVIRGKLVGNFDYIQWYFGKDADREFLKDCKCSKEMDHAPDGYWIRNVNPKIRTYSISNSAQYVLQTRSPYSIKWNEKVTKSQFLSFLKERNKDHTIPFHIEVKNGVVTKITEQYIP